MKQARRQRPAPGAQPGPAGQLKTPQQVRAEFERRGQSIRAWALQHQLQPTIVYEILQGSGRRRCLRGQSHRAAVLLGLKDGELAEAA